MKNFNLESPSLRLTNDEEFALVLYAFNVTLTTESDFGLVNHHYIIN